MTLLLLLLMGCPTSPKDTGGTQETAFDTSVSDTSDTGGTEPESCRGDDDGRISWDEFVADPALGITAIYTVNAAGSEVEIPSVEGTVQEDDTTLWDFSGPADMDSAWSLTIRSLEGTWFADSFPTATYYVGLDASEQTWGIYQVDDGQERLFLLGLASAADGESLLVYDTPVVVFEFPVSVGKSWKSEKVEARGVYDGVEYPADYGWGGTVHLYHTYGFEVDAAGKAQVPLATFDALRLHLYQVMSADNDIYGNVATTTQHAYFFMAECTGLVARIRGREDDENPDFRLASEYLRLGM